MSEINQKQRLQSIYPDAHIEEIRSNDYSIKYRVVAGGNTFPVENNPKQAWITAGKSFTN